LKLVTWQEVKGFQSKNPASQRTIGAGERTFLAVAGRTCLERLVVGASGGRGITYKNDEPMLQLGLDCQLFKRATGSSLLPLLATLKTING